MDQEPAKRKKMAFVIVLVSVGVLVGLLWLAYGGAGPGVLQCEVPDDPMFNMPNCE